MAKEKPDAFLKRAEKAKEEMDLNRGMFEDAYENIMPYRNTWNKHDKSHRRNTKMYDSTAMIAANNFVNTMQSNFTPVFQKWAEIKAGPAIAKESERTKVNKMFQEVSDKLHVFRNASNFYTSAAEMYFDLGVGTGVMFILKGTPERPFNYVSVPLSEVALEEGKHGEVSGLYRRHKCKPRYIEQLWKGAKLSDEIKKAMKEKPDDALEFCEGFYYDYDDLVWRQDVVWKGQESGSIFDDVFKEAPFVAPRWMKVPGFATGIGPFLMAMPDIKTLSKMKELMLILAALNAFGVYTVANGGTFNASSIQIKPGAFIPVERNGTQNPSISALPRAGDFQVQEFMVEDLKTTIRQVMLDNRLPPEDQPVRTAYEIAERIKDLQMDIGAAFGRLVYEFVLPLHKREISILQDMNLIQLPDWFELDNFYAQVQVISPIASQQSAVEVDKLAKAFELTASISPELALLTYDIERIGEWIADKLSVDATLVREQASKERLQELAAQLIAQAQQQAQQGAQQ